MVKLLPCPFCGSSSIDPEGWASTDRAGPACDECGGTADTVELWNSRPNPNKEPLSENAQWALTELQGKEVLTGCTSYVQRKLQIGFNRAASILEELEDAGWISEADNSGARRWLRTTTLPSPDGNQP